MQSPSCTLIRRFNPRDMFNWLMLMLALALVVGCKPKPAASKSEAAASPADYFQTPFQSECQFIVHAVVTDLAEQIYYAAHQQLPEGKSLLVTVKEKVGTALDSPEYEVQITLPAKLVQCDVTVNAPIWAPQVYGEVATKLAQAVALNPNRARSQRTTSVLGLLKEGTAEAIERANQRVSAALEKDFTNPELHEQAALLFGAFLLRDHSGKFFEIRSPLARLTAHLTMARLLRDTEPAGADGQMAEAMMLTLVGNEALALERLRGMDTNSSNILPFVRALRARNTGDYRELDKLEELSRIESLEWFHAWAGYVDTSLVWPRLSNKQKQTIDFVRTANYMGYSVETGHELLAYSIPLELQELATVYAVAQSKKLSQDNLLDALNELPTGCFTRSDGAATVRVISWGQWANFLQRHLCHAIQQNFYFMNSKWGVREEAKEFADKCEESFGRLYLYPFVRRFNCTDVDSYHQAVDDGFKVTVATPHLVPAECWNYLCYKPGFAPRYTPNPNPHVNEWHSHNPPPGTLYDLYPRLNHPSLTGRPDALARFEQLHEMAPYDCRIIYHLLEHKYKNEPTYDQAAGLFQAVLPYGINAMRTVAQTVYKQPERYEQLMLQSAALDPSCYYMLGDYKIEQRQDDAAAKYIDQACAADHDSVRISNHSYWRVQYYLKKGQLEKAREIADEAGEVYSAVGLEAKASFLEATTNYAGAFEWFAKIEERYEKSGPLIAFCQRYKSLTGDTRFEPEVKKRLGKLFPKGVEKVSLADFRGAPVDGVVIKEQNDLVTAAGLNAGDVIVALDGTRTHNFNQYGYVRSVLTGPEMHLIVWQGNVYREVKASPPDHKFGVDFGDYRAR